MRSPLPAAALRKELANRGVHAGVPVPKSYGLGDAVLLSATELTTEADIDALVTALKEIERSARPLEAVHG